MDVRARALAAFQAFAIGDALGMPTQLLEHERASDLLACDWFEPGPQDSEVCPGLPAATITDDTWQLLMLADNLIAGDGQFEALKFAEQMLDWESSMIRAGSKDLLGPSTKRALDHLRKTGNPSRVSISGTTNGASMRAPAIGLLNSIAQEGSERLLVDKVVAVNRVSHNSNEANVASVAVAAIISAGIDGNPLSKATERGLAAARLAAGYFCEAPQPERLVDKIEKALGSNQLDDLSAAKFFVEEILQRAVLVDEANYRHTRLVQLRHQRFVPRLKIRRNDLVHPRPGQVVDSHRDPAIHFSGVYRQRAEQ